VLQRTLAHRGYTIAIVQSRMGSKRVPGKALADINGHPLLWHVVRRAEQAELVDRVVVATGDGPANDPIANLCDQYLWACFRGSEDDVLARYYGAAQHYSADVICRVNGDTPLYDGAALDSVIALGALNGWLYATNAEPPMMPDGLDSEAFTSGILERMHREAKRLTEREHVTPWLRNGNLVRGVEWGSQPYETNYGEYRGCVDVPDDLVAVRRIFALGGDDVTWRQAIEIIKHDPDLMLWQSTHLERDAAYKRQTGLEAHVPVHVDSSAWHNIGSRWHS